MLFSDIVAGCADCNSDTTYSIGNGAYVTVWGYFNSTQGTATICGEPAASIIYWGNAVPPASPSPLYDWFGMQMAILQVNSTASGSGGINITVNNQTSNNINFTVQGDEIFFIKTTGHNSNNGSWSSSWETVQKALDANQNSVVSAGDIIYVCDGVTRLGYPRGAYCMNYNSYPSQEGNDTHHIAMVAYPNATVKFDNGGSKGAISNYGPGECEYWDFAKFYLNTTEDGAHCFRGRHVAHNITGPDASGQGGAFHSGHYPGADNSKILGNYIWDFGDPQTTSKLHHSFYISNRCGYSLRGYELGWNVIDGSGAYHGLHLYDEAAGGDFSTPVIFHDNIVKDQKGAGLSFAGGTFTMDFYVYNNLFINCGLGPHDGQNNIWAVAVFLNTWDSTTSHVTFYNNIIYGYGDLNITATGVVENASYVIRAAKQIQLDWVNNVVVDTKNISYFPSSSSLNGTADLAKNNLWYNGSDGPSIPPSWDNSPLISNPLFRDPEKLDFFPQNMSPLIDAGNNTTDITPRGLYGYLRPFNSTVDIGATEWNNGTLSPPSPPPDTTPQIVTLSFPNIANGTTIDWGTNVDSGDYPLVFSIESGSIPSGLFFNTTTGNYTSTANSTGNYSWTITVTDTDGDFDNQSYSVDVYEPTLVNTTNIVSASSSFEQFSTTLRDNVIVPNETNMVMITSVSMEHINHNRTIDSVWYNGTELIEEDSIVFSENNNTIALYSLIGPDVGDNELTVNISAYYENLTAYSKTDENGDINCNATHCVVDTMRRDANSWVIKDHGENFFNEFKHVFSTKYTQSNGAYVQGKVWMLSNENVSDPKGAYIKMQWVNISTDTILQLESGDGTNYWQNNITVPINTWVWVEVARNENDITADVYNDSNYSELRQHVDVPYNASVFRYHTVVASRNSTTDSSTISYETAYHDIQSVFVNSGTVVARGANQTDAVNDVQNLTVASHAELMINHTAVSGDYVHAAAASVWSGTGWVPNSGQTEEYDQWSEGTRLYGVSYNSTINQTYSNVLLQEENDAGMISVIIKPVEQSQEDPQVKLIEASGISFTGIDIN